MEDSQNNLESITLEEAEKQIYQMITNGDNYNQISQVKFPINGNERRFNPSQISKIKAKFEQKNTENKTQNKDSSKEENKDDNKAKVFALFKKGTSPVDVLIKTRLDYDFIKKSHEQYLEMAKKKTVPEWFVSNLYDEANNIKQCNNITDVFHCINTAFQSHYELEEHVYFCSECGDPIPIRGKSLGDASVYLSTKWHHKNCN